MRAYLCQIDIAWETPAATCAHVRSLLDEARPQPSSLLILPEMFATGFSMNINASADTDGSVGRFLSQLARDFRSHVLAGVVSKTPDNLGRNESVLIGPDGRELLRYQKIQTFTLGGESTHYQAGRQILTHKLADLTLCPFICYDLRFPELFRSGIRKGAELFTVIASWPFPRDGHWVTLLQARAIENQAWVIGVNRMGEDPKFKYPGRSMVIDPKGQIIVDAGPGECIVHADIDRTTLESWRSSFPALCDMKSVEE